MACRSYLQAYLFISCFGFKSGICLLIAPVPVLCFSITFRAAGISGNLLNWFVNYLENRRQRVVISGVQFEWNFISAGVPQVRYLVPFYSYFISMILLMK